MLRRMYLIAACLWITSTSAQEAQRLVADSILAEGLQLFELQKAARYSADLMFARLSTEQIAGNLSYFQKDSVKTIYWTYDGLIKYTFCFAMPAARHNFRIEGEQRKPSKREKRLIKIKEKMRTVVAGDSFFESYKGMSLDCIMMETKKGVRLYLISSTPNREHVPLGNDYLLTFKRSGKLKSESRFHQNLIPIQTKPSDPETEEAITSLHQHADASSPYITATDICNLLLYKDDITWDTHIVISSTFVSLFKVGKQTLNIITREQFNEIGKQLQKHRQQGQ